MLSKRVTTRGDSFPEIVHKGESLEKPFPKTRSRKCLEKQPEASNAYERERMKRIVENREIFKELGLDKKPTVAPVADQGKQRKLRKGRRAVRRELRKQVLPVRRSRRFKGKQVKSIAARGSIVWYAGGDEAAQAFEEARDKMLTPAERKELKRDQLLSKVDSSKYQVPFSLTDTLEIISLGELQNSDNGNWWSNPGCLFHHEYPVGYKARKFHWVSDLFGMTSM